MKSDGFPRAVATALGLMFAVALSLSRPWRSVASCAEPRANHDLGANSTVAAHSIKQIARSPIAT
jgi:hypothetical protein